MTARWPGKERLFLDGHALVARFCAVNGLAEPAVRRVAAKDWRFGACAFYRPGTITISVALCAGVGAGGPAWSYPGYIVDRTPYGVLSHELGHHVDVIMGHDVDRYRSDFSRKLRAETREAKLTNYCPDDGEWFAEIFRLFVTNPDLLRLVRPKTYAALLARGLTPVWDGGPWRDRLAGAPARTVAMAERRIAEAGGAP